MMILSDDFRCELMIDMSTGVRFKRKLSKREIFEVIDSKYSLDQAEEKIEHMQRLGLDLMEMLKYSMETRIEDLQEALA